MDLLRHWSGETLHAELLYDGDVSDASAAWQALGRDWRLRWEGFAVALNSHKGAVEALRECREALAARQVSGERFRTALAKADAILGTRGGQYVS